jgi:hypothetical protein
MALRFGADDVDGTILEERIMHAAKAQTPVGMARDRLVRIIREAGCVSLWSGMRCMMWSKFLRKRQKPFCRHWFHEISSWGA